MLEVRPAHAPPATRGQPYEFQIVCWDGVGPYTFKALSDLPDGLTLDDNGKISGTPTGDGAVITVEVTDTGANIEPVTAGWTIDVINPKALESTTPAPAEPAAEPATEDPAPAEPAAPAEAEPTVEVGTDPVAEPETQA